MVKEMLQHSRLLALLALVAVAPASGALIPGGQICVTYPINLESSPESDSGPSESVYCTAVTMTPNGKVFDVNGVNMAMSWMVEVTGEIDPDPYIDYNIDILNTNDVPLTFFINLFTPVAAVPYERYKFEVLATLFDLEQDGVLLEQVGPDGLVFGSLDGNFECGLGGDSNSPGVFGMGCSVGYSSPYPVYNQMGVTANFRLSPFDRVTMSGRAELFPLQEIPEPGTYLMLGAGLLGMLAWRRRRR